MPVERKIGWKPREANSLIGGRHTRLEGSGKATGHAKFAADTQKKDTLIAKAISCPHAHATIKKLDTSLAAKAPGVKAVHVFNGEGIEIKWEGSLVAAVAAETADQARDAAKLIKVEYEVLPHWVDEADLEGAIKAEATRPLGDNQKGDVAAALKTAKVVVKGRYGVATISHMCMEPHGSHCEWTGDDELEVTLSTQNVSGTGGQFAGPLGLDATKVHIKCDYIGGGFGSKFAADEWGLAAAKMAKDAGRPVRLMLDRAAELKIAGTRPSGFADVTIAANADGEIIAWDSHHWGTSGLQGSTVALSQYPYVFEFANRNRKATGIKTNCGPNRAWRAPPHPQLCALTDTAIDDVAAKLGMDSLEVFRKNLDKTPRPEVYGPELDIAAKLIDWKKKWHAHGKGAGKGPIKQGLGVAIHQWGGRAHAALCTVKVHPDGAVESFGGSQDIGTGTRTAIAIVLAETFGLPLSAVKVNIGSSKYPRSGPSGGSTTIGGVSGPNRRAALQLLWQITDLVAKKYEVEAGDLTVSKGAFRLKNKQVCTWKEACSLIGPMPIEAQGEGPKSDGLTDSGVGGVQMADVSVDIDTGKVKINKLVAVQDCGLIIDRLTAESQVYGGLIMGIAYAVSEERIMDNKTGRFINADLVNYKLPRIGDIGELVVEMYEPDDQYDRGVIGLGEPPVIATGAAISNAVANAIGVRVSTLPLTPKRVLEAL
ncbi:MAG: xanthine dehydrogenase family protein molybdopterin-binding subunit [Planctomycetota bacterium]|nr:xanthine dehydrogenase family protein molybdopterin-binding subunit [Planctomycetota bacterium]